MAREMTDETTITRPDPLRGPRTAPNGRQFPWGVIDEVHSVGPYQIVEYRQDSSRGSASMWAEHGTTRFHPYVDGKDTCIDFPSLDAALVGAVSYRAEGPNGSAAHYFMRMMSWPPPPGCGRHGRT